MEKEHGHKDFGKHKATQNLHEIVRVKKLFKSVM